MAHDHLNGNSHAPGSIGRVTSLQDSAVQMQRELELLKYEHHKLHEQYQHLSQMVQPERLALLEYEYYRKSAKILRFGLHQLGRVPLLMPALLGVQRYLIMPEARLVYKYIQQRKQGRQLTQEQVAQRPVDDADSSAQVRMIRRQQATDEMFERFEATDMELATGRNAWCSDQDPEVSIIILNWNRAEMTIQCLKEIWKHTSGRRYEVIVVDNGSRADEYLRLKRFVGSFKLIRLSQNRFFGEGNNIGAEASRGKYLVFLNNDAFVTPGWLEPLAELLDTRQEVGAVGPMFLYPDGWLQEAGAVLMGDGSIWLRGHEQYPIPEEFKHAAEVDYCSAAALMMRRDAFFAVNGFDFIWEPAYYEDVDLCLRIKQAGWQVHYCPDAQIVHIEHVTSDDPSHAKDIQRGAEANREKFLQRWEPYITASGIRFNETSCPLRTAPKAPSLWLRQSPADRGRACGRSTVGIYTPFCLVPGGGERYLLTIAEHLSKTMDVTLVLPERHSRMRLAMIGHELNLDLSRIEMVPYAAVSALVPFDLFIAMGNEATPPAPALGKRSLFLCQFPFSQPIDIVVGNMPYIDQYERIVVYSDFVRQNYQRIARSYGLEPLPMSVLTPPCFSEVDDRPTLTEKAALVDALEVAQIVSVGRFFPGGHCKRHDIMIEALRQMLNLPELEGKRVELHLAGTVPPTQACQHYYQETVRLAQGLPVVFHPNASIEEMAALLRSSTFYWHATGYGKEEALEAEAMEHFGISVVEAMANGCVPLVVDRGGPATTVVDGVSGQHYKTVSQLARQTAALMRNPQLLSSMRTDAYVRAERYTKEQFTMQLELLLLEGFAPATRTDEVAYALEDGR